jgi:FtsZ-binding cell division protein ZapB
MGRPAALKGPPMIVSIGTTGEIRQLLALVQQLENTVNKLQTAIQVLQVSVNGLAAASTAAQGSQYTQADVDNLSAINGQVQALTASLAPPAPPADPSTPTA